MSDSTYFRLDEGGVSVSLNHPLPVAVVSASGDATAANQVLQIAQETAINTVLGTVAVSPTANTIGDRLKTINTTLAAGQVGTFLATKPVITTGTTGLFQLSSGGALCVEICAPAAAVVRGLTANVTLPAGSGGGSNHAGTSPAGVLNYQYNGTSLDPSTKLNVFKRVASSAASGNPDFAKASAGDVALFWGSCGATAAFLQLYNKASAPTVGSDTPVLTYPIIANANFTQTIPNGGAFFSTGIAFAFTTDAAGTTGSAAAAITSFALLGA